MDYKKTKRKKNGKDLIEAKYYMFSYLNIQIITIIATLPGSVASSKFSWKYIPKLTLSFASLKYNYFIFGKIDKNGSWGIIVLFHFNLEVAIE